MNHIKTYNDYNEGLKSAVAGVGLAGALLSGSPDVQAREREPITMGTEMPSQDGVLVYKFIDTISKSNKSKIKDTQLIAILDEIKSHSKDSDSAKYLELFDKLASHLENHYNYQIDKKELPSESSIGTMKEKRRNLTIAEILGWLGSICLAICGIPQAWMSYKDKHSHGISWAFLLLWAFGEVFALAYVYNKLDAPLLLNYAVNIGIVGIILFYKIKPQTSIEDISQE
jgi:uncharacterized protein with PQ loop repeat